MHLFKEESQPIKCPLFRGYTLLIAHFYVIFRVSKHGALIVGDFNGVKWPRRTRYSLYSLLLGSFLPPFVPLPSYRYTIGQRVAGLRGTG